MVNNFELAVVSQRHLKVDLPERLASPPDSSQFSLVDEFGFSNRYHRSMFNL